MNSSIMPLQEMESNFPPCVQAGHNDSPLANRKKWKWPCVTLKTKSKGTVTSPSLSLTLLTLTEVSFQVMRALKCPMESLSGQKLRPHTNSHRGTDAFSHSCVISHLGCRSSSLSQAFGCLRLLSTTWWQLHETSWARTTWLICSQIHDPHKLWDNKCSLFKSH